MDILQGLGNPRLKKRQRKIFIESLNAKQLSTVVEIVESFLASYVHLKKTHLKILRGGLSKFKHFKKEETDLQTKREILNKIPVKFWKVLLDKADG